MLQTYEDLGEELEVEMLQTYEDLSEKLEVESKESSEHEELDENLEIEVECSPEQGELDEELDEELDQGKNSADDPDLIQIHRIDVEQHCPFVHGTVIPELRLMFLRITKNLT